MKITVYTVSDCKFSKEEKDFLKAHNLPYEEKNLESNREFLTEMLAVSNNFAGTPVTKVEKDDGKIEVLKGFTEDEFNETLGLKTPAKPEPSVAEAASVMSVQPPPLTTMPQPVAVTPTPSVITPPTGEPTSEPAEPQSDELNSILADLKAKAEVAGPTPTSPTPPPKTPVTPQPVTPPPPEPKPGMPPVPPEQPQTPPESDVPSVPDFPSKT